MALGHIEGFDVYGDTYNNMPSGGSVRRLSASDRWAFSSVGTPYGYGKAFFRVDNQFSDIEFAGGDDGSIAFQLGGLSGEIIWGGAFYYDGDEGPIFALVNALGNQEAALGVTATGYLQLYGGARVGETSDDPSRFALAEERPLVPGSWHYIEARIGVSTSQVWVDGDLVIDYTGSVPNTGQSVSGVGSAVDLVIGMWANPGGNGACQTSQEGWGFDDVYIVSTTGGVHTTRRGVSRVEILNPDTQVENVGYVAVGGTNVEDRLSTQDGDTTGYTADADGDKFLASSADSLSNTPAVIHGIEVAHVSKRSLSGSISVATLLQIGSTEYEGTAEFLGSTYEQYRTVYEENPDTTAEWAKSEIEAADFGFIINQP